MAESIMEHIARVLGKDPLEIRLLNMNATDKEALVPMIEDIKKSSDYDTRKRAINEFNSVSGYTYIHYLHFTIKKNLCTSIKPQLWLDVCTSNLSTLKNVEREKEKTRVRKK